MAREKALNRPKAKVVALPGERLAHLFKGDVGGLLEQRQDQGLAGVDTTGPTVATQHLWTRLALLAFTRSPAAHAGCADAKAFTSLAVPEAVSYGPKNTCAKI